MMFNLGAKASFSRYEPFYMWNFAEMRFSTKCQVNTRNGPEIRNQRHRFNKNRHQKLHNSIIFEKMRRVSIIINFAPSTVQRVCNLFDTIFKNSFKSQFSRKLSFFHLNFFLYSCSATSKTPLTKISSKFID